MSGASAVDDPDDPARLVLAAARTLLQNGEDTSGVLSAARALGEALGCPAEAVPRWGEIGIRVDGRLAGIAPVTPWGVNMRRVVGTLAAVDAARAGRLKGPALAHAVAEAAQAPAANPWLFALMCGLGAATLSVINGAVHPVVLAIVGVAAFLGGLLRRVMGGRLGIDDGLAQLFAAALLAGVAGGVAVRCGVPAASGLAALGPLLVLNPGPSLIGATFDLMGLRLPLGMARLAYGLLSVVALSAGVLIGAGLAGGVTPDWQSPTPHLRWWQDMACAGVASAAYAVFFSMPYRMLALPVMMGACAHGLRWLCLTSFHLANASAAGIACLLVGVVVEPIARQWRLPFAAVGFASVVAQVPGSYLFRMGAGLVELQRVGADAPLRLLAGIAADGGTALLTLVTMALGLAIPKSLWMQLGASKRV